MVGAPLGASGRAPSAVDAALAASVNERSTAADPCGGCTPNVNAAGADAVTSGADAPSAGVDAPGARPAFVATSALKG